jgi:hypothetical protein
MADYEWVQPEEPTPRRGGIPWLWLLLGFVVLMMFLNSRAQQQPARPPSRVPIEPTQAERTAPSRSGEVQREGDWSLEEMPGHATPNVPASTAVQPTESAAPSPPKKTQDGDWQIEEVSPHGNDSRKTPQTTENRGDPAAPPNKSTKGDWTIEEVKPAEAPSPNGK